MWVTAASSSPTSSDNDTGSITQFQQCLAEVDALLRPRLGSGQSWSDIATSQLESRCVLVVPSVGPVTVAVAGVVFSLTQHQRLR